MSVEPIGSIGQEPVYSITLRSGAGATAKVITWGATLADLVVPWRGRMQSVVLGLRTLDDYVKHAPHMGAIAGRFANRIRNASFELDGEHYDLPRNFLDKHCLHGGGQGFGKRPWQLANATQSSATLTLVSPHMDAGFPGELMVSCEYRLLDPGVLSIVLTAVTDRPTPLNLAHHSYFNLDGGSTIEGHSLQIEADFYTCVDHESVSTGEVRSVMGTPYDFRSSRSVISQSADGTVHPYDNNFCLRGWQGTSPTHAATLRSERNGLTMELWTNQPGLQFYDGHKVKIPVESLHGPPYGPRSGLCLEPQFFPDSPNLSHFPSCILRPGRTYRQETQLRFAAA